MVRTIRRYKRITLTNGLTVRSTSEARVIMDLENRKIPYQYESRKIKYNVPAAEKPYTPDVLIQIKNDKEIFIEVKGEFNEEDRKKHLLVKTQYPDLDIRFLFDHSKNRIRKGSKTTYGDWCDKYGFKYADKYIPQDWLDE